LEDLRPGYNEEIAEVDLYPDDYMDLSKYEATLRHSRYLGLLALYEYLAFTYSLRKLDVPDPGDEVD
jgi:hypothetical protein